MRGERKKICWKTWKTRQKNDGTMVNLGKTRLKSFVITSEGEVKGVEIREGGGGAEESTRIDAIRISVS